MARVQVQVFDEFLVSVEAGWLTSVAETALCVEECEQEGLISVVIADDETVSGLNIDHRGLETTTDVLSFSNVHSGTYYGTDSRDAGVFDFVLPPGHQSGLGEVIISLPQAERQAEEVGHSLLNEVAALVAHGIFHLLGYDHEVESDAVVMQTKEIDARDAMRKNGLID
ncbi:Endoribonuclease YbeY [Geodia barretti]|uniref:Endoribonuclease YbeY n=1 Tax=Geodia barretti TaxID=519541 RepID=A0AA35W6F7_GEOBA|nr:Endoribonuclease YbeY [Geodia barretti]